MDIVSPQNKTENSQNGENADENMEDGKFLSAFIMRAVILFFVVVLVL